MLSAKQSRKVDRLLHTKAWSVPRILQKPLMTMTAHVRTEAALPPPTYYVLYWWAIRKFLLCSSQTPVRFIISFQPKTENMRNNCYYFYFNLYIHLQNEHKKVKTIAIPTLHPTTRFKLSIMLRSSFHFICSAMLSPL